jgi:hypothetical protein
MFDFAIDAHFEGNIWTISALGVFTTGATFSAAMTSMIAVLKNEFQGTPDTFLSDAGKMVRDAPLG